jgi:hypothetical protein
MARRICTLARPAKRSKRARPRRGVGGGGGRSNVGRQGVLRRGGGGGGSFCWLSLFVLGYHLYTLDVDLFIDDRRLRTTTPLPQHSTSHPPALQPSTCDSDDRNPIMRGRANAGPCPWRRFTEATPWQLAGNAQKTRLRARFTADLLSVTCAASPTVPW